MGALVESALQTVRGSGRSNSHKGSLANSCARSFGAQGRMKVFDTQHLDQRTEIHESLLGASLFVSREVIPTGGCSDSTKLCDDDALAIYDSFSVPSTPTTSLHPPSIALLTHTNSPTSHFRDAFSTSTSTASVSERAMDLSLEALLDDRVDDCRNPATLADMYFTVPDSPVNVCWEQICQRFGDKPDSPVCANDSHLSDANPVALENFWAPHSTSAPSATAQAFLDWASPNPGSAPAARAQNFHSGSSAPCSDVFTDRVSNHLLESLGSEPTSVQMPHLMQINSSSTFDDALSALQILNQSNASAPVGSREVFYTGVGSSGRQSSGGLSAHWPMTY
jgi:hypothetical protein